MTPRERLRSRRFKRRPQWWHRHGWCLGFRIWMKTGREWRRPNMRWRIKVTTP